jgi:hypothetical protein
LFDFVCAGWGELLNVVTFEIFPPKINDGSGKSTKNGKAPGKSEQNFHSSPNFKYFGGISSV